MSLDEGSGTMTTTIRHFNIAWRFGSTLIDYNPRVVSTTDRTMAVAMVKADLCGLVFAWFGAIIYV